MPHTRSPPPRSTARRQSSPRTPAPHRAAPAVGPATPSPAPPSPPPPTPDALPYHTAVVRCCDDQLNSPLVHAAGLPAVRHGSRDPLFVRDCRCRRHTSCIFPESNAAERSLDGQPTGLVQR